MGIFKPDWHSLSHLFGSYFLVRFGLSVCGFDIFAAVGVAFGFGILYEIADTVFAGKWIFDPRGGDIIDIFVDAVGCILAIFI